LTDADMPPIESLDEDSDYAQFLSPQVGTGLRRRALRKLFRLPRFQGSDGLVAPDATAAEAQATLDPDAHCDSRTV